MRRFSIVCCISIFSFSICQSEAYENDIGALSEDSTKLVLIPCCQPEEEKGFVKARIVSCSPSSFVYPKNLIAIGAEGHSGFSLTISKTGDIEKVELYESSGFEALDSAAMKGIKLCKFSPSTRNGEKVESKIKWKYIWRVPETK